MLHTMNKPWKHIVPMRHQRHIVPIVTPDVVQRIGEFLPLGKKLLETTEPNWHQMLAVNLTGPFLVSQVLMPHLIQSKGSIIMMASVAGMVGIKERTAYCATKGGVISLMRSIALDYVGEGVRCNAICPGTVDTPWVDRMVATYPDPVQTKKQMTNRQPMGRLGQPHEIASGAVYLASKDSNFVTGSCLVIDGGLTMQ